MKRSSLSVLLALLPLTLAAPSPDVIGEINLDAFLDLPAPTPVPVDVISTSVDLTAIATSLAAQQSVTADDNAPTVIPLRKRQSTCKPFSSFATTNPDITPSTVSAFKAYQPWKVASGPLGTYGLPVYEGFNSVGPKNGLLSVNTYKNYDPNVCKAMCDGMKSCASFAIWRERVPTQLYGPTSCPNPSSEASYQTKCLYYAFKLTASDATNQGQWTNNGKFYVTQTSAKFFNKNAFVPAAVDGFTGPSGDYGRCAPQGLTEDGDNVEVAAGTFHVDVLAGDPGPMTTAIDPSFCASTCNAITSDGKPDDVSGIKRNCNMFSLFLLRANGKDAWQCQYWTKDLDPKRNTNCGPNKLVVASWKYVTTPSTNVDPYYITAPPQTPQIPQCTGSDDSTYGVTCIEDFKNIVGRSDSYLDPDNKESSSDGKPDAYLQAASRLAGFTGHDMYYVHNKPDFGNQDATKLVGDGFFGMVSSEDGDPEYTLTANGFSFDLESMDLARYYINSGASTMKLEGLRGGRVVTQPTPDYPNPREAGQEWIHATRLYNLGFRDLDAIRMVSSLGSGGFIAFKDLVLTRRMGGK